MIDAVLFDLDDTLYPQSTWLDGAWADVARRGAELGAPEVSLLEALRTIAADGSDRGRIIDRALARIGCSDVSIEPLVTAFRSHAPARLFPYPGVRVALEQLRRRVPIGLVTDGDSRIQRSKLQALAIDFDAVVFSDDLGRGHRKPDAAPLRVALERLRVTPEQAIFVGDRPAKDVAAARAVGMRAIRVRTGEYAHVPDDPAPWRSVPDAIAACTIVGELLARPQVRGAQTSPV
jgi:HAD superfamily hydrolase (TIGR01509 family)